MLNNLTVIHNSLAKTLFSDLIDHIGEEKYVCLKKYFQHMTVGDVVLLYKEGQENAMSLTIDQSDQLHWLLFKIRILKALARSDRLKIHHRWLCCKNHFYIAKPGILDFVIKSKVVWDENSSFRRLSYADKKLITEISYTSTSQNKFDLNVFKRDALPYLTKKDFPNLVKLTVDGVSMLI